MPRRADPENAERRRDALVRAGYAEIVDKGIHGMTLDSVVVRAGTSKGGALYYYRTKEDLLFAVLQWLLRQLDHTLDEIAHTREPARARLASELEVLFHSEEVNRKLYLVLFDFVSLAARSKRFQKPFQDFFSNRREADIKIIEDGIRDQQFRRVRPDETASAIRALVDGYCLQWLLGAEDASLQTYRDRCRAVLGSYLLR